MAWITPKTNWMCPDIPTPANFNAIEGNIKELNDTVVPDFEAVLQAEIDAYADESEGTNTRELLLPPYSSPNNPGYPPAASASYNGRFYDIRTSPRSQVGGLFFCRTNGAGVYIWVKINVI